MTMDDRAGVLNGPVRVGPVKFGTKRPQVQILSPRPHLRRSQARGGLRGHGQARPEGTMRNAEGTRENNLQALVG